MGCGSPVALFTSVRFTEQRVTGKGDLSRSFILNGDIAPTSAIRERIGLRSAISRRSCATPKTSRNRSFKPAVGDVLRVGY